MAQLPTSNPAPQQQSFPTGNANKPKRSFDPIPEGVVVNVEVVECELRDIPEHIRKQFNIRDAQEVSFRFRVTDGPYAKRNLWGTAKPYIDNSENCRLRLWAQELMGVDKLPEGYVFDTDDFTGLSARVLVSNRTKQDGTVKDGVGDVLRSVNRANNYSHDEEPF